MKNSLYIYQNGELSRKDNTIRFTSIDGTKRDMPINSISEIYFFGENTFNTKLITFLAQNNIIAHFFNYYSFYAARDLGANSLQTIYKVMIPLSIPGIVSGVTMVFVPALTTFVISNILGGSKILLIGNVIEI